MQTISITKIKNHIFDKRDLKVPRDRFIKYYKDLYKMSENEVREESFYYGSQYAYVELGEPILDWCKNENIFADLDLLVCAYWAYEFDPDYTSCGAYFSDKYHLQCTMFDVCDQGVIATITGLNLITHYFREKKNKKALLMLLEQDTIPQGKNENQLLPQKSFSVGMLLEKNKGINRQQDLLAAEVFPHRKLLRRKNSFHDFVQNQCLEHGIHPDDLIVYLRPNGIVDQKYHAHLGKCANSQLFNVNYLSHEIGCAALINSLQGYLQSKQNIGKYAMFFEENQESKDFGFLLIKKG